MEEDVIEEIKDVYGELKDELSIKSKKLEKEIKKYEKNKDIKYKDKIYYIASDLEYMLYLIMIILREYIIIYRNLKKLKKIKDRIDSEILYKKCKEIYQYIYFLKVDLDEYNKNKICKIMEDPEFKKIKKIIMKFDIPKSLKIKDFEKRFNMLKTLNFNIEEKDLIDLFNKIHDVDSINFNKVKELEKKYKEKYKKFLEKVEKLKAEI